MTKQRYLNDKPVREATEDTVIQVGLGEIKRGVPGSFTDCALALGCERKKGVLSARIERTIALVEREDRWDRYIMSKEAQRAVITYDVTRGQGVDRVLTGAFVFKAPTKSQTTASILARALASKARGVAVKRPRPGTGPRHDPLALKGVRNGTGHGQTRAAPSVSHLAADAAVVSEIVRKTGATLPEAMAGTTG